MRWWWVPNEIVQVQFGASKPERPKLDQAARIARAKAAARVMEDPIFREAVEDYNWTLVSEIQKDGANLEALHLQIMALKTVVGRLTQYMREGKYEVRRLSDLKKTG